MFYSVNFLAGGEDEGANMNGLGLEEAVAGEAMAMSGIGLAPMSPAQRALYIQKMGRRPMRRAMLRGMGWLGAKQTAAERQAAAAAKKAATQAAAAAKKAATQAAADAKKTAAEQKKSLNEVNAEIKQVDAKLALLRTSVQAGVNIPAALVSEYESYAACLRRRLTNLALVCTKLSVPVTQVQALINKAKTEAKQAVTAAKKVEQQAKVAEKKAATEAAKLAKKEQQEQTQAAKKTAAEQKKNVQKVQQELNQIKNKMKTLQDAVKKGFVSEKLLKEYTDYSACLTRKLSDLSVTCAQVSVLPNKLAAAIAEGKKAARKAAKEKVLKKDVDTVNAAKSQISATVSEASALIAKAQKSKNAAVRNSATKLSTSLSKMKSLLSQPTKLSGLGALGASAEASEFCTNYPDDALCTASSSVSTIQLPAKCVKNPTNKDCMLWQMTAYMQQQNQNLMSTLVQILSDMQALMEAMKLETGASIDCTLSENASQLTCLQQNCIAQGLVYDATSGTCMTSSQITAGDAASNCAMMGGQWDYNSNMCVAQQYGYDASQSGYDATTQYATGAGWDDASASAQYASSAAQQAAASSGGFETLDTSAYGDSGIDSGLPADYTPVTSAAAVAAPTVTAAAQQSYQAVDSGFTEQYQTEALDMPGAADYESTFDMQSSEPVFEQLPASYVQQTPRRKAVAAERREVAAAAQQETAADGIATQEQVTEEFVADSTSEGEALMSDEEISALDYPGGAASEFASGDASSDFANTWLD